jgi:hypothetical protein
MQTISKEEYKQKYGAQSLSKFSESNRMRFNIPQPQSFMDKVGAGAEKVTDAVGLGGAVDVFGSHLARMGVGAQTAAEGKEFIQKPTTGQTIGAVAQTAAVPLGAAITGGSSIGGQVLAGASAGYLYDVGSDLIEQKDAAETITPGIGTVVGAAVPPAVRGFGAGLSRGTGAIAGAAKTVADAVPTPNLGGAGQIAKEYVGRIPRAIERGREAIKTAQERGAMMEKATPQVKMAVQSGLDDVVIQTTQNADEPTKEAYRKMVKIAEQPRTNLRPSQRPESVAGEAASEQYKLLETQRRTVGSQIGDAVDVLSTQKGKVDVLPAQRQMRDVLRQNGILPDASGKLQFQGTKYTPSQRQAIQQLYELATEGGEQLTPRQVYDKDQLFSKLQREARFGEVGDIMIDVPEGSMSMFRAFKNIYANQLDTIAPEIRDLNKQYRLLKNLLDDTEASIVKSGNFETTGNVDPAEFAQTNLRRLFSDAQSAADYRKIYENLDALSRELGYKGARADDLAGFAQRLREIYPETVPETSFGGGISGGIMNVVNRLMDVGAPNVQDKQKALKALLEVTD